MVFNVSDEAFYDDDEINEEIDGIKRSISSKSNS